MLDICALCEGYHSKSNRPNRRTCRQRLKWKAVQVSVGIWLMVWALITCRSVSSEQPRLCPVTGKCWGIAKLYCPGVFMHETVACLLRDERHCLRIARTHKPQLHTKNSRRDALWGRWGQWGLSGLVNDPAWMLGRTIFLCFCPDGRLDSCLSGERIDDWQELSANQSTVTYICIWHYVFNAVNAEILSLSVFSRKRVFFS